MKTILAYTAIEISPYCCAGGSSIYNSYQIQNDKEINKMLDERVHLLSKQDIEQLNKLK